MAPAAPAPPLPEQRMDEDEGEAVWQGEDAEEGLKKSKLQRLRMQSRSEQPRG